MSDAVHDVTPDCIAELTPGLSANNPRGNCHHCKRPPIPVVVDGSPRDVDACIADIVIALNAGGVRTLASCCGHEFRGGSVLLADRELIVVPRGAAALRGDHE